MDNNVKDWIFILDLIGVAVVGIISLVIIVWGDKIADSLIKKK